MWKADLQVDCQDKIEYKFIKVSNRGRADSQVQWEQIDQNRTINCRNMISMVV